jgi:hypothetical protein
MAGRLYLCATPIGNLEDITFRAVRTLREVDVIAAEDTRNSIKLLNHFEIKTPLTSYHEFNKYDKAKVLVNRILGGENVALITDAGTPGISDPGEELVRQCYEAGVEVTSLPGAAACITALTLSGLSTRRFVFEAFLPNDKKEKTAILEELRSETRTIILYEAPHRLKKTITELVPILGNRKLTVVKELTKLHENVFLTTLEEALDYYQENEPRGEFVLVIEGKKLEEIKKEKEAFFQEMDVNEHMKIYLDKGMDKKEAMKAVAVDRGIPKREVYKMLLADT